MHGQPQHGFLARSEALTKVFGGSGTHHMGDLIEARRAILKGGVEGSEQLRGYGAKLPGFDRLRRGRRRRVRSGFGHSLPTDARFGVHGRLLQARRDERLPDEGLRPLDGEGLRRDASQQRPPIVRHVPDFDVDSGGGLVRPYTQFDQRHEFGGDLKFQEHPFPKAPHPSLGVRRLTPEGERLVTDRVPPRDESRALFSGLHGFPLSVQPLLFPPVLLAHLGEFCRPNSRLTDGQGRPTTALRGDGLDQTNRHMRRNILDAADAERTPTWVPPVQG